MTTAKCATGTSRHRRARDEGIERFDERLELGQLGHAVIVRGPWRLASSRRCAGASSRRATRVHAVVVDAAGAVLASAGDPELPCMLRSAAKPLQALPAVRDGVIERYDLEARHVAVACGSHEGTPAHAAAVADVVARAGLPLAALRPRGVHPPLAAGAARALLLAGRVPTVLEHNCSGNHALMLLRESMLARDPAAYLDADGPAQADATAAVARGVWLRCP